LPLLYEETAVKEHLIRLVEMGPFKHKVDDGLDIRKYAFECMYTLLETSLDKLELFSFLGRVLLGLSDQHDIALLSHTMLIRLTNVAPTAVMQKLDEAVDPLKATVQFKSKENAVKSEIEKNTELVHSAIRVMVVLAKLSEQGSTPKFDAFVRDLKSGAWSEYYTQAEGDAESKGFGFLQTIDSMDLS